MQQLAMSVSLTKPTKQYQINTVKLTYFGLHLYQTSSNVEIGRNIPLNNL